MANIARYTPIRDVSTFDPFDDPFEELFRGFFLRPMRWEPDAAARAETFRVDVIENDKEFRMHAEIPGVRKEDINVSINGDEVAISAESKIEKDVKDGSGTVVRSERQYGKMYRAFTLGAEVDQAKVEAKYTDGVLELILPKAEAESTRRKRITVH